MKNKKAAHQENTRLLKKIYNFSPSLPYSPYLPGDLILSPQLIQKIA